MSEITRANIVAAADRISSLVRLTPVLEVEPGVMLKLDLLQPTGSFKVRGAFSFLTAHPDADRVVAASGGNFGLAIAYAASRLDRHADIFVPGTSPAAKIERLTASGATVHVIDGYYAQALEASREFLAAHDALEAHAYDHPDVVAGQGTCGREIMSQIPDVDTVVVSVGGAGLIGGIASWVRDDARVVAVETHGTSALHSALMAGEPVEVDVSGVAADSLGAARVGGLGFEAASRWVDPAVLVSDADVREAQGWLWNECRLVAEPGGAAALAAIRSGVYPVGDGERVCVLVCGANADPSSVFEAAGSHSVNVHQPAS